MSETKEKRYFIVNPSGTVHEVTEEHARWRLKNFQGYRPATKAQVEQFLKTRVQRHNKPIGEPWNPQPEDIDVGEIMEAVEEAEKAKQDKGDPRAEKDKAK